MPTPKCKLCKDTGALPNGNACCACGCADRLPRVSGPYIYGGVSYEWEPLASVLDDGLAAIVEKHWREVGVHKKEVPLAVDWGKYQEIEDKGILKLMVARRGEKMVGYSSYMVLPHLHYSKTLHAVNDAIFVMPKARGAGIGLIRAAERALAEIARPGYVRIIYHAKLHVESERGTLARVFERLGYAAFETSHDKVVRG